MGDGIIILWIYIYIPLYTIILYPSIFQEIPGDAQRPTANGGRRHGFHGEGAAADLDGQRRWFWHML